MEAIDILSQSPDAREVPLHLGDDGVSSVELRPAARLLDLTHILPRPLRPLREHLAGKHLLDGEAFLRLAGVVQSADAPVRRQAGVSRHARPGHEQDAPRASQMIDDAVDRVEVGWTERHEIAPLLSSTDHVPHIGRSQPGDIDGSRSCSKHEPLTYQFIRPTADQWNPRLG
jgi:hypothetical protein